VGKLLCLTLRDIGDFQTTGLKCIFCILYAVSMIRIILMIFSGFVFKKRVVFSDFLQEKPESVLL